MSTITELRLQPGRPREVDNWLAWAATVETSKCLLFPYQRNKLGYGLYVATTGRLNRKKRRAHNRVCEIAHGPPPSSKHRALHSCDNPPCCNKAHLRWGLPLDNSTDMVERDRHSRGERHPAAKVSDETVRWIRELVAAGNRQKDIAEGLGMAKSVICEIVNRKAWRHVL
jgi:hypothetical protein